MRRGMNSLAIQVQQGLGRDPHAGDLYVFRGKRGHLIKLLWHDGIGMSLDAKRWSAAGLFGRHRLPERSASPRRSWPICLRALTGATRCAPGGQRQRDKTATH